MSNHIDIHVGQRLRFKRIMLGMSQDQLGQAVGVTFQQVQKYEKGQNRIGSSRLYEFAKILRVPVSYFFEDIDEAADKNMNINSSGFAETDSNYEAVRLDNKEILNLVRAYSTIGDPEIRKRTLALIKSLSTDIVNEEELATTA